MNRFVLFSFLVFSVACGSQKEEELVAGMDVRSSCNGSSAFLSNIGYSSNSSAFTTNLKNVTGLALVNLSDATKFYQHETWKDKGALGPIAIDEAGNVYVAPIPFVNVLDAMRKNQHQLYKVSTADGSMTTGFILDKADTTINNENAYGFVGLYYDCDNKFLYASTLQGSTKSKVAGRILCLDVSVVPFKVVDELKGIDAMGLAAAYLNNELRLFFGETRSSAIKSIAIKDDGKFIGKPRFEFSLSGLGPRGDDIAKKIRFDSKARQMNITGALFNYNLVAPSNMPESKYGAYYDLENQKWVVNLLK
jgi:hypothetical protein